MSLPIIPKQSLSKMLRDQLEIYNKEHPDDLMDYDILFLREKKFQLKRSTRYSCLSYAFNDNFEQTLLDKIEKSFNTAFTRKQKKDEREHPTCDNEEHLQAYADPLDCAVENFVMNDNVDNYMNGDYCFYYELPSSMENDDNNCDYDSCDYDTFIVTDPNALFYNLARVLHMDESRIMLAFYSGEGLDIEYYGNQYVNDVVDYYFEKSKLKLKDLVGLINKPGFKISNIANIINPYKNITYDQFETIAPHLNIPKDLTNTCKHLLAQSQNPLAYKTGYQHGCEDFYDDLAERGIYEDSLYLFKLFKFLGFSFPDQPNMLEKFSVISSYLPTNSISVITPKGTNGSIRIDKYFQIVEEISDYAAYLLEKECSRSSK